MSGNDYTDEILMAYADGQLDPETTEQVAAAVARDQTIAARVAVFDATAQRLADLAQARPDVAIPEAILRQLREPPARDTDLKAHQPTNVLPFLRKSRRVSLWQLSVAASVLLAIGALGGWIATRQGDMHAAGILNLAALENPELARLLSELPSGEKKGLATGGALRATSTFANADDELCREFEFIDATGATIVSVACRTAPGWNVRMAVVTAAGSQTGYAPASSLETLDAYLDASGAGAPMSIEDEARALKALRARQGRNTP